MTLNRVTVVQELLGSGEGRLYLEIGVQRGESFRSIRAGTKIGVDPGLGVKTRYPQRKIWELPGHVNRILRSKKGTILFGERSDDFFARYEQRFGAKKVDVALIDGLHTYEQSYRDVQNVLARLSADGVIVMHDCRPRSATSALRDQAEARRQPDFNGTWNGDVYKTIIRLRNEVTDRRVIVLDVDQGLGLIFRASPDQPVAVSLSEIADMSFQEFAADRDRLLGLRPSEAFETEVLPALRR